MDLAADAVELGLCFLPRAEPSTAHVLAFAGALAGVDDEAPSAVLVFAWPRRFR